jgi:hypothetical protein
MSEPNYVWADRHVTDTSRHRLGILTRIVTPRIAPTLSVLWELARQAGGIFPETWNRFLFRRFWGDGISSTETYLVIDNYEDVRLRNRFRWADSSKELRTECAEAIVQGTFSPQAAAMLSALFLRHTGKVLRIATDAEVVHKRDATLICYGTSDFNFKTYEIEAWSGSDLCQFSFNESGERAFRLGGQLHSIEIRDGITYDKAMILRLNGQPAPRHCQVVCAGLSEWGSLAAVHYLTKKWKVLQRRFDRFGQRRDFCVLLELQRGQFENAREVASAVLWEPRVARE